METKIEDLFVVYGSETKLLKPLFDFEDSYFIRIYNKTLPEKLDNASDVNSFEKFIDVFEEKLKILKPNRVVFIGAAFLTQQSLLVQEKWEHVEKSLEVNVINYVKLCHYLLPYMMKIKSGHYIYLSSFRAEVPARGISLYSASKAFGENFFEVLGLEGGAFGVYATSIRMGYFDGRMTNSMGAEKVKQLALSIGDRRLGNQSDLIGAIKFALENSYTNGGVIDLTGGINHQ